MDTKYGTNPINLQIILSKDETGCPVVLRFSGLVTVTAGHSFGSNDASV